MKTDEMQMLLYDFAGKPDTGKRPRKLQPAIEHLWASRKTHDGRDLHHDELTILSVVAREIDDETNSARAWWLLSSLDECECLKRPSERNELLRAVGQNLRRNTIAFFDVNSRGVASGTLVSIEGRCFVATAAHAIPTRPNGRLSFIGSQDRRLESTIAEILHYGTIPSQRPDVGFLEIRPGFAHDTLEHEPVTLDRIAPIGAGKKDHLACVIGFPAKLIEATRLSEAEGRVEFTHQCYFYTPIMPEDWSHVKESHDRAYKPDRGMDVFLPYLIGEEMSYFEENPTPRLSEPKGISGGGVWQPFGTDRGIWAAEKYRLIAIQSRWPQFGRYLQATQIIHWLRLLYAECIELRPTLRDHFAEESLSTVCC